jgi:hypothetical protein
MSKKKLVKIFTSSLIVGLVAGFCGMVLLKHAGYSIGMGAAAFVFGIVYGYFKQKRTVVEDED